MPEAQWGWADLAIIASFIAGDCRLASAMGRSLLRCTDRRIPIGMLATMQVVGPLSSLATHPPCLQRVTEVPDAAMVEAVLSVRLFKGREGVLGCELFVLCEASPHNSHQRPTPNPDRQSICDKKS